MSWQETVVLKIIELGGAWFLGLVATLIIGIPVMMHIYKRCRESDRAFAEYINSQLNEEDKK
jgi:hypothetical protein